MRTIFITGAAHGLGLATARRFAAQGWYIGLYDIDNDSLATLLASGEFPNACGHYCDVTDRASIEVALAHFSENTGGTLDVLVNNAGMLFSGKFEEIDPAAHERLIAVNVLGLTNVAQAAFSLLQQTRNATLVNLCSVSSVHGVPRLAVTMEPDYVAQAIQKAVEGKRTGYVLGASARIWKCLDKLLPEYGRRALVRYLTNY